jgi:tetratricopeptide (TPR) repeat protein
MNFPNSTSGDSRDGMPVPAEGDRSRTGAGSFEEVLAGYLLARDVGDAPDQESFVARHPDLSKELRAFFANEAHVEHIAEPFRPAAAEHFDDDGSDDAGDPEDASHRLRRFGDYELLGEIARGGMGVVYRARQTSLNRIVALKMVLAGQFASAHDVRRFQVEAANAATLDHPNIVPVYDVGRHRGQHYYTMKLIEGGSLAARVHRYAGDPRGAARLVATTARAIDHAHRHGVLHRDLKPGNILIDAAGQPQVTDFGLARRLGGGDNLPGLTLSGSVLGSPRYMAPEQAKGETPLATAADVYSLGAILYELLTGRPPFLAQTLVETLRLVRETEPLPPTAVVPRLDRDLGTICLKCLEKEPAARYAAASDLADDLDRWLRHEPITARTIGPWRRARKWARRKPAAAALLAVSACSVALLIGGLGLNNFLIAKERTVAIKERNAKQAALDGEASLRKLAVATLESLTDDVVRRQLARQPVLADADREFLERIAAHYEALVSSNGEDRAIQAAGHSRIGLMRAQLGQLDRARASYARAIELYGRLVADHPEAPNYRDELVGAHAQLGRLLSKSDRREEAAVEFRRAIDLGDRLVGAFGDKPEYRRNLAHGHNGLGGLMAKLGRHADAATQFRRAIALDGHLVAAFPGVAEYREGLANSYNGLGVALTELGNDVEAEATLRHALGLREQLVDRFPREPKYRQTLIASHCNLGNLLGGCDAEGEFRRAIVLADQLVAEFPVVPAYRTRLANAHHGLGVALAAQGEGEPAEAAFRRAIELRARPAGELPATDDGAVRLGSSQCSLGDLLRERGSYAQAVECYREAIATLAPVAAREPRLRSVRRHLSRSHAGRAAAFVALDRLADAAQELDALAELNTASGGSVEPAVRTARLLVGLGRFEQQLAHWRPAVGDHPDPGGWRIIRTTLRQYFAAPVIADIEDQSHGESPADGG